MEVATIEGVRITWEVASAGATLTVERPDVSPPRPPATLRFTAAHARVRVGLVLLGGRREIDVSIQPSVVAGAVGVDATATDLKARRLTEWLLAFGTASGTWVPGRAGARSTLDLLTVVGGGSFPLLGAAYDQGASPIGEVPRWSAPVVASGDARAAATQAFGSRATRPVVAALASSLVPAEAGRPVALYPLALALMAPELAPDRLARVLRTPGPPRPPAAWPDVDVVATARRLTPHLGQHRTERLLTDAAAADEGPTMLADALVTYALVRHRAGRRLPNRLNEFRAHCASLLPPDPNPDGLVAPRQRRRPTPPDRPAPPRGARRPIVLLERPPPPPPPTPAQRRGAMYRAPATVTSTVAVNQPVEHPVAVAALASREVSDTGGRLRFLVPRTDAELAEWGRRLHNCIGGFGPAVHEGESWLLGIESGERLAYCIEITPAGTVRQFLGEHNRPVPRRDALAVVEALAVAGLLDRTDPHNAAWFEATPPPSPPPFGASISR